MADETTFWTQRDAAREYTRLSRVCGALFAALGPLAPRLEPPKAAAAAAQLARRLGLHAASWAELVPESVLLAPERDEAVADPVTPLDGDLRPMLDTVDALRADLSTLLTRTSEIADATARRQARSTLADIDDALDELRSATAPAGR